MYKISNFTTTRNIFDQLGENNIPIKLPFKATGFKYTGDIPAGVKLIDREGKDFKPIKVKDEEDLKIRDI
jgi:hypothetical protein